MKLRAPQGCIALSHQGRMLPISSDGSIEIERAESETLVSHGFVPLDTDGGSTQSLQLAGSRGDSAAGETTVSDISKLNRVALFALLKERGVPVSLPITNQELRALAAQAAAT
jgi:hypothetical protein